MHANNAHAEVQIHYQSTDTITTRSAAGFRNVRAPTEKCWQRQNAYSENKPASYSLCRNELAAQQKRPDRQEENKKKKEKFSEKEDRTACRKDGAPDMKDNQITAHLPLTHSILLCRSLETQE